MICQDCEGRGIMDYWSGCSDPGCCGSPICWTCGGLGEVLDLTTQEEIAKITEWLKNRPSATMDPSPTRVRIMRERLRQLKKTRRNIERPPSKMMEAQTIEPE